DFHVTGVQTCALPICTLAIAVIAAIGVTGATAGKKPKFAADTSSLSTAPGDQLAFHRFVVEYRPGTREATDRDAAAAGVTRALRSEERRVGDSRRWRG